MFIYLAKSLDLFLSPLTWALCLGLLALLVRRRSGLSLGLAAASLGVLYVFSLGPVAEGIARGVESSAPRTFRANVTYDAVIVLGGALDAEATQAAHRPQYGSGVERILTGYELLRTGAARYALLSGGLTFPTPGVTPEADVLKAQLMDFGIPESRIYVEDQSRDTRENAVASARVVKARGWRSLVLVTSAAHMPRALGCFHAAGLAPDALPVRYHTGHAQGLFAWLFPRASCLAQSTELLRELAGRLVYRALGYSRP